jgi:hypothetical protein
MEDGTVHGIKHNALLTSHAPWVQKVSILGIVNRQRGGPCLQRGGGGAGGK